MFETMFLSGGGFMRIERVQHGYSLFSGATSMSFDEFDPSRTIPLHVVARQFTNGQSRPITDLSSGISATFSSAGSGTISRSISIVEFARNVSVFSKEGTVSSSGTISLDTDFGVDVSKIKNVIFTCESDNTIIYQLGTNTYTLSNRRFDTSGSDNYKAWFAVELAP